MMDPSWLEYFISHLFLKLEFNFYTCLLTLLYMHNSAYLASRKISILRSITIACSIENSIISFKYVLRSIIFHRIFEVEPYHEVE